MGYIRKAHEYGIWNTPNLHAGFLTFLSVSGDAYVACCLSLSTGSYHVRVQIHIPRCCIKDDRIKWLQFGRTPDLENLQPHPGFVWVKEGYSEPIACRKV